ncbi:MAG: amidohydrolase [Acidobacteriota bacterium]
MILIKDCRILPMTGQGDFIENGYIVVDGDQIKEIKAGEAPNGSFSDVIDGRDMVAMPGLINAHTHAAMTLLRSYADDLPLMEWLETKIWPVEDKMTGDDIYWGTMLCILEMIKSGTTCFADMYFKMDRVAEAVAETGIRASLSRGMIGVGPENEAAIEQSRELVAQWHRKAKGRIEWMLGPHAPYTCPPDYLKRVIALSEELDVRLNIHLSETLYEFNTIQAQYGKTPIGLMEELGLFERPVVAAHCVHLTDDDIEILARRKVGVVHNPESNMKLASGIARVTDMLAAGIPVALGTDGASSNNDLDMIQELRSASFLQKVSTLDPLAIPAYTALEMATVNGAKALGLDNVGMLKPGMKADIILIDLDKPHLYPHHDITAHIAYAASGSDVDTVLVNGKVLMQGRKMQTIDEQQVISKVKEHIRALLAR